MPKTNDELANTMEKAAFMLHQAAGTMAVGAVDEQHRQVIADALDILSAELRRCDTVLDGEVVES